MSGPLEEWVIRGGQISVDTERLAWQLRGYLLNNPVAVPADWVRALVDGILRDLQPPPESPAEEPEPANPPAATEPAAEDLEERYDDVEPING